MKKDNYIDGLLERKKMENIIADEVDKMVSQNYHSQNTIEYNFHEQIKTFVEKCKSPKHSTKIIYSLYLRSFESTDQFRYKQKTDPVIYSIIPSSAMREKSKDLERLLAEGLEHISPLTALGRSFEHDGALRIESFDDEWKTYADELIKALVPIFVVPSSNSGTLWEINRIIQLGALEKTIFIMPPKDFISQKSYEIYWESHAKILHTIGVDLPKYIESGALFRLTKDGGMYDIMPADFVEWASFASSEADSVNSVRAHLIDACLHIFDEHHDGSRQKFYSETDFARYENERRETGCLLGFGGIFVFFVSLVVSIF